MQHKDEEYNNIIRYMEDLGYFDSSYATDKNDEITQISFLIKDFTVTTRWVCVVYPHNDNNHEFELRHLVNPGALTITTNVCGPLYNKSHFKNQEQNIIRVLRRLYDNT